MYRLDVADSIRTGCAHHSSLVMTSQSTFFDMPAGIVIERFDVTQLSRAGGLGWPISTELMWSLEFFRKRVLYNI